MNFSHFPNLLAANNYRIIDYTFPTLIPGVATGLLVAVGLIVASFAFGIALANAYRQRDSGWKIGLILSTVLVSAFAGKGRVFAAYEHAVRERYRFFSYGDAMLLFPAQGQT